MPAMMPWCSAITRAGFGIRNGSPASSLRLLPEAARPWPGCSPGYHAARAQAHSCDAPLAQGEQVKVVSGRLGHASPVVTMTVYAHVLPGSQRQAAARFAAAIEEALR